jgi:hypothetical protein
MGTLSIQATSLDETLLHLQKKVNFYKALTAQLSHFKSKKWLLDVAYLHSNYKFSSDNGSNFNHYNGDTNVFTATATRLFAHDWAFSWLYQNAQVDTKANVRLAGTTTNSDADLSANSLGINLKKTWLGTYYLEGFGQFGTTSSSLNVSLPTTQGSTRVDGDTYLLGSSAGLVYPFHSKWALNAMMSLFYFNSRQGSYSITYDNAVFAPQGTYQVGSLNLTQLVSLTYKVTRYFRPFANFGLIEVLSNNENRSTKDSLLPVTSQVPEFLLNNFGYNVGGGINANYKMLLATAGYSYAQRGSEYHSNSFYASLAVAI